MTRQPPVLSPVDYDAWNRGYTPPSEHILIDQLAYRGARVVCSSSGPEGSWWFVVNGVLTPAAKRMASKMLHANMEFVEEPVPPAPEDAEQGTSQPQSGDAALNADDGPGMTSENGLNQ